MRFFDFLKRLFRKKQVQESAEDIKPVPEEVDVEPAIAQEHEEHFCLPIKHRFQPIRTRAEVNSIEFILDRMEEKRMNKQIFKEQFLPTNITNDEEDYFYLQ